MNSATVKTGLISPEIAQQALRAFVEADTPVILMGPPGIGKSAAVYKLAEETRWPLFVIVPAIREPADFGGYPVPDGEAVRLRPVGGWLDFARAVEAAGNGILFLDEVPAATLAIQNALLRVVLDRVVGEFALPSGVRIVCAGNPPDTSAGGWELSAAFANRLAHLDWPTPTVEAWVAWLMAQPCEELLREPIMYARHLVASFLSARQHLLLALPPGDADRGRAWPSPRSWAACANVLGRAAAQARGKRFVALGSALVNATVGPTAAEFGEVLRGLELVDPEELLANPAVWDERVVPACATDPAGVTRAWSALVAVTAAVLSTKLENGRLTKARWFAAWEVHRCARESSLGVAGAAVAALGIPLGVAALEARNGRPAGPAHGLPMPEEALKAIQIREAAMGGTA